jgi:hypothetical protein
LEIGSGGAAGGAAVSFASSVGGVLQLDSAQSFSGTIAGFDQTDTLDLSDIAFNSSSTTLGFSAADSGQSGTLTVSDGTDTADLTLFGQYTAGEFILASDGHGGTLIGLAPAGADTSAVSLQAQLNQMVQAMASYSSDSAGLAAIHAASTNDSSAPAQIATALHH